MRQAGRYLPEYRETRAKAGGFLDLCYTPELAAEVTLQPIRRYGFDAAILFSDILVVPDALGQKRRFRRGRGAAARCRSRSVADLGAPRSGEDRRASSRIVFETVTAAPPGSCRDETALIGFCGAPWTVATYMVAGRRLDRSGRRRGCGPIAIRTGFAAADRHCWSRRRSTISTARSQPAPMCCRFSTAGPAVCRDAEFDRWVVEPTTRHRRQR